MTPELQKGRVYYRCHRRPCTSRCVREDQFVESVSDALSRVKLSDANVREITKGLETWFAELPKSPSPVSAAKFQLGQINARLERSTDARIEGLIDQVEYDQRVAKLVDERAQFEAVITNAKNVATDAERFAAFCVTFHDLPVMADQMNPTELREFFGLVSSARTVDDHDITV